MNRENVAVARASSGFARGCILLLISMLIGGEVVQAQEDSDAATPPPSNVQNDSKSDTPPEPADEPEPPGPTVGDAEGPPAASPAGDDSGVGDDSGAEPGVKNAGSESAVPVDSNGPETGTDGPDTSVESASGDGADPGGTPPPEPGPMDSPSPEVSERPQMAGNGDVMTDDLIALQQDGTKLFRRETRGVRRTGKIVIDGVFRESDWQTAPKVRFDWQERPVEGGKATGATEFQVLYDDQAIYFAVYCMDPEPDQIRGILHRSLGVSKMRQSDWVIIFLDPILTRTVVYAFAINPVGVQIDVRSVVGPPDVGYNAIWGAATSRDDKGWYAEIRIPYSQMRVNDGYQGVWGLQMQRQFSRTQERDYWSPYTERSGTKIRGIGNLVLNDRLRVGRSLELMPYFLGGTRLQETSADNQLRDYISPQYGAGLDAKIQVSDSLRLFASINPDFGQVEADPSQVNLTEREYFFTERRPLFVENSELYQFDLGTNNETLFYSRRLAARPHFSQAGAGPYVDEADTTTLYGAAKLSGEIADGVNLGTSERARRARVVAGATGYRRGVRSYYRAPHCIQRRSVEQYVS